MQAIKHIDELKAGDTVVLDDGRRAVVQYNGAYVTYLRPSVTMVMHRVVTVTADGSTEYVDGAWRDLVPVIVE
mgnify:FL=1